jgi:cytochrome c-type biogenesis protein CcmH
MVFWLLAISIAVVACAALYYAGAGRLVNASEAGIGTAAGAHFRQQLREIEADSAAGRLPAAESVAARAELARELLRQQREAEGRGSAPAAALPAYVLPGATGLAVLIAFATYAFLGSPGLPSQPFAARADAAAQSVDLGDAIRQVEARLAGNPGDLKGWQVIAPVYMQSGQFAKAEHAFRQILALAPPTADAETDLAEALMMQHGGAATGEAADLLHRAGTLDPRHVRSRFYLAAEATRQKDYPSAVAQWSAVIALGTDTDPWLPTAKAGLAAAEAGRDGRPLPGAAPAALPAVLGMVNGLGDRLTKAGGPLADWTELVRSEIVLGDLAKAQSAYDSARKAYPDAGERAELDGLAAQAGLKLDGGSP